MNRSLVALSLALTIALSACDRNLVQGSAERKIALPKDLTVSKPAFASQRFLPTNSADIAFDTKTGSLCKTWGWSAPEEGDSRANLSDHMDTCDRLYTYDIEEESRRIAEARQH